MIVIVIVVPSDRLPSSSSPTPKFAPPDATWRQGTASRDVTGSGLARRGGEQFSPTVNDDDVNDDEDNIF